MAAAIEQAVEQSPTFRQLVSAITDGIVYVHYGACARNIYAPVFCWRSRRPDRTASFTSGWIAVARPMT